ncbi:hypothetical protein NM208_g8347 [Fusarium decemcellulare]|uniref:Uncharacterized protein n=1 Tax=Fusarium decemcellulare TaxID=57161 RepID=A0ACC1S5U3_9HYPO|nr:hypothetical protein NM208_g8347 [Fusarium decemcellulare]
MSSSPKPLTVFITGAAGGLGRVIATAFLDKGANVAICDVNEERLAETTALWGRNYPDRFIAQQADVASLSDIETLVRSITSKFGRLDILINNAAVLDKFDPAGTCSQEIWDRILRVNLTGAFVCTKVAVNTMQAQSPPGGSIINMGSNASVSGTDGGLAYTVSKHGILALTRNTAAYYLDHDITCTMLQLGGLAATNIQDSLTEGVNMEGLGLIDKHMPGFQPGVNDVPLQDVAKFCIFLTDRELAKTLNGASVPFNRNWPAGV